MTHSKVKLLRYPGGKQRLLSFLLPILPTREEITGRYIEPFVGGGAVFFAINPKQAILSDINTELIDLYKALRSHPTKVWKIFASLPSDKDSYYKIRAMKTERMSSPEKAARTLYLNRTCFKGMWRHNSNGDFNVGYGGEDRRWAINKNNLMEVSERMKTAWLRCSDFTKVVDRSIAGDFIFLDPPYKPGALEMHDAHYAYGKFTMKDHKRLVRSLDKATQRGVKWAMTTSNHPSLLQLFSKSNIIAIPKGTSTRLGVLTNNPGEVLVCNYTPIMKYEDIFRTGSISNTPLTSAYRFS